MDFFVCFFVLVFTILRNKVKVLLDEKLAQKQLLLEAWPLTAAVKSTVLDCKKTKSFKFLVLNKRVDSLLY